VWRHPAYDVEGFSPGVHNQFQEKDMSHRFQKGSGSQDNDSGGQGPGGPTGPQGTGGGSQGPSGPGGSSGGGCSKVALIVGGLVVALLVLPCIGYSVYYWGFLSEEERAQMEQERKEKEAAERKKQAKTAEKVLDKFEKVGTNMPKFTDIAAEGERNCPEDWTYDKVGSPQFAGDRFFEQFTSERFAPRYDLTKAWVYTSEDISAIQKSLEASPEPENWENLDDMHQGNKELLESKYYLIYYPDFAANPKIENDESFIMGEFDGWLVLINTEKPSEYCFAKFLALSSRSVRSARDSILHDENKKDMEILNDDYANNFDRTSKDALMRILSGQARPYPKGGKPGKKELSPELEKELQKVIEQQKKNQ
jgi:hypothetical protein